MANLQSKTVLTTRSQPAVWAVGVLMVTAVGCTEPTRLTATGITRTQAVTTLWECGKDRRFTNLWEFTEQVWEDVNCLDEPKAVLTYKVEEFFSTAYGRDVVHVVDTEPNVVSLALLCKLKHVPFNFLWGILCPYSHHVELERSIMFNTALALREAGASIAWQGPWMPRNMPTVVSRDGGLWIAYTGAPPSTAIQYLQKAEYEAVAPSGGTRLRFRRDLTHDPDLDPFPFIMMFLEPWESHEQVLVKVVRHDATVPADKPVIVVGASAVGTHWTRQTSGLEKVDIGPMLRERVVSGIALAAAVSRESIVFVDPSPWIESLEPAPPDREHARMVCDPPTDVVPIRWSLEP